MAASSFDAQEARRESSSDDDLLRKTIDASCDIRIRGAALNPQALWIASLFGGPIAAAIAFGFNAHRLGQVRLARVFGGGFALLGITIAIVSLATAPEGVAVEESGSPMAEVEGGGAAAEGAFEDDVDLDRVATDGTADQRREPKRDAYLLAGIVCGGIGFVLQRRRFRLFCAQGGEPRSALLPCVAIVVVAVWILAGLESLTGLVLERLG